MTSPLILNFDDTAGPVENAVTIDLRQWQEAVRFGCSLRTFSGFTRYMQDRLPDDYGTVLLGSGDFHHVSWPLIERCGSRGPFQVVLLDNHPDNMRFPWGIHCGSWVRKVALLPYVSHLHVVGVTSSDIGFRSSWEQYWTPLLKGKLTYWCMNVDVGWAKYAGLAGAFRRYATPDALIDGFLEALPPGPTYLTIDKDALSADEVHTNWDQGALLERHLMQVIHALRGHIVGSDITGEVSVWKYRTRWKAWLSAMDGQHPASPGALASWQERQRALNARLLAAIAEAGVR